MGVEKNVIRLLFYTCTIIVVLTLVTTLNLMYLRYLEQETDVQLNTLESGIIEMKKLYLKSTVDTMIQHINFEKETVISEESEDLYYLLTVLHEKLLDNNTYQEIEEYINSNHLISDQHLEYILYDNDEGKIVLNTSNITISNIGESQPFTKSMIFNVLESERYRFFYTIPDDIIHNKIRTSIKNKISKLRLIDNGYIWINEILDFNGGDRYATRFVHPNLPDTEGSFLSTNTLDSQGNKPYQIELDGMNQNGELYFEYYFKKMEKDTVAHKMSYAKLYRPYNWVVATGVYLDDVDELIEGESRVLLRSLESLKRRAFALTLIAVMFSITIIILFEGKITRLILRFHKRLEGKNREIEREKELIKRIAYLDPLTSILNRRAITNKLETQLNKSKRHFETFTIAIIDIDDFKLINDTYGHDAGDLVIKTLCNIIKNNIRKEDAIGRWGGEEFMIILDHSNMENAKDKFDSFMKLINKNVTKYHGHIIGFSVTIGSYTFHNSELSLDEMIKAADDNLYIGKRNGKNQYICS